MKFTAASCTSFSAETDVDGLATAAVPGLALGDAAFDVTVADPGTVTLAAGSLITMVAAAVTPVDPATPTPAGSAALDAPGAPGAPGALAATGFPAGAATAGVLALFGLGAAGILVSRRARIRA